MELYPAIDLRGGRCVRLFQGDYGRETAYDADPVAVAESFVAAGARWVHVVDLDAARTGEPVNRDVVGAIAAAVAGGASVQAGGGVRDRRAAAGLADAGVARVVLGTAAVENPDLVRVLAKQQAVAVGLDARGGEARVRGWTEGSGAMVVDLVRSYEDAGVQAVIVTDIERDGTLCGPDLAGLGALLGATSLDVIASGGVGSLEDLRVLARLSDPPPGELGPKTDAIASKSGPSSRGLAGAIVGKAIHDGLFTVEEAIVACAPSA